MKCRIVYNADKTVSVIHPAIRSRKPGETEESWYKRVFDLAMKEAGKEDCLYDDIEENSLPTREDRNAWEGEKVREYQLISRKHSKSGQKNS